MLENDPEKVAILKEILKHKEDIGIKPALISISLPLKKNEAIVKDKVDRYKKEMPFPEIFDSGEKDYGNDENQSDDSVVEIP